ncbi:MAG TPA: class I SAM-dependent methyltransferase, partial [Anditalea sp.]|nr:class I SAM-dependent methyltransferase [Anditalea sp.]
MKDNFSHNPSAYAAYRPSYPDAIFHELQKLIPSTSRAWDVGTGNGQVAVKLSSFMDQVEATDISAAQMSQASLSPNINYSVQPAEKTNFEDDTFDLITIGQAIHWFD